MITAAEQQAMEKSEKRGIEGEWERTVSGQKLQNLSPENLNLYRKIKRLSRK